MEKQRVVEWVSLLEASCTDAQITHLDIIVDQSGEHISLLSALNSFVPSILWQSLFKGLPEEVVGEDAPLLIRIDLQNVAQRQWMMEIMTYLAGKPQLLVMCSLWPFAQLAEYLTTCLDVSHCGHAGILRFYDPRLFPILFTHVLNMEQQHQLLRPALFWSWTDRDGAIQKISGEGMLLVEDERVERIDLDDHQLDSLLCVCDANTLLARLNLQDYPAMSEEQRFQACYHGMIEATKAHVLMEDAREQFVVKGLLALSH